MNKLLLISIGLLTAIASHAQGLFTANNNYNTSAGGPLAYIRGLDGLPLAKALGRVEIITPGGESLLLNGSAGRPLFLDGIFNQANVPIPGSPAGSINVPLVVRAWDSSTGATWDLATSRASATITVGRPTDVLKPLQGPLGGGLVPAATFAGSSDFVGLQLAVIPEPSTIALAAFGIAGLFFVARRKK